MSNDNVITMRQAETEELIEAVIREMERHKLSQAKVSQQIGKSGSALNQFLKGSYPSAKGAAEIAELLGQWLDSRAEKRRSLSEIPKVPGYTETPSSKRIHAALAYAQMFGDSAVIYGVPGVGKTFTAQAYQRGAPSVWIATMSPSAASIAAALEEICEALGLRDAGYSAAKMKRAILRRLRDTEGLLVIDEAQHLSTRALEEIRSLNDASGVGLAFMGSEVVYVRMTGGNRANEMAQLFSRQGKRVHIQKTSAQDIAALLAAWKIDDTAIQRAAEEIGTRPGGLRGLTKTLRLASMFAAGEGKPMTRDHVAHAWRDLGGE
ncbi:MAG: AAA family ATPase [Phycisphaeraceae bacterium]